MNLVFDVSYIGYSLDDMMYSSFIRIGLSVLAYMLDLQESRYPREFFPLQPNTTPRQRHRQNIRDRCCSSYGLRAKNLGISESFVKRTCWMLGVFPVVSYT